MKRFRSTPPAIASALIAAVLSAGARPRYGGTLRIETDLALRTIDPGGSPADAGDAGARTRILPLVFETLVAVDPAGGLRPMLAVSWESDGGLARWRFHLRSGVRLHDGSALDRLQVAAVLGTRNPAWRVSGTDDGVVIESDRAMPGLPWELSDVRYAIGVRRSSGELAGTGPFRVDRLEGGRVFLRAHQDYWRGRPFLDAVDITTGKSVDDLAATLELGRADMVNVRPTDARRLEQRGLRVVVSQPVQLMALMFEPVHAAAADDRLRAVVALALDRSAMCGVLLHRRCEPAFTLLPDWLSGYASVLAARQTGSAKALTASLTPRQRTLSLRVDEPSPVTRLLAERIVVDAHEAGLTVSVQPQGLAPRPDLRLTVVRLSGTAPERALGSAVNELTRRGAAAPPAGAPPAAGASLEAGYRFERGMLDAHLIVPVVFLPDLYGLGPRIESWEGPPILPSGAWDLANVWAP